MLTIVAHATTEKGKIYEAPANTLVETLKSQGKDFTYIRHSIDGKIKSTAYIYKNGGVVEKNVPMVISKPAPLRYVTEILGTIYYFLRNRKQAEKVYYIGLDPLNALTGLVLKKLGLVKKVVFYTADYTKKRFTNRMLNNIYLTVDSFCVRNADEVWSVSSRIVDVRKQMGLNDTKNIFLPNVPSPEYKQFLGNQKNKFHLVTLGIVSEQMDYIGIFDAVKDLKNKYPELLLKIIGSGPKEEEYKKYVETHLPKGCVLFMGYLTHNVALEEISKSGVGLALYNGKWDFNYYGDSMKCREYFCYGLPAITTDTHSTVMEIATSGAGVVCAMGKEEYKKAIEQILNDYQMYSERSKRLSALYQGLHEKLLNSLLC